MPDFSKGGYYNKIHSRAYKALLVGALVACASAVALPLFMSSSIGLAFTYFGFLLVAICAYKWSAKVSMVVGMLLSLTALAVLPQFVESDALLQICFALILIAFVSLSIGFSKMGRISRDFHQIKFSFEVPKAADSERLLMLLDKELARAKRYRRPSSLAVLEIGILEKAEKAYGHHQTELLLRQIQLALLPQLRRCDTLAWLGGPYFALLLPETRQDGAEDAIERLREAVRSIPARPFAHLGVDVSDWRFAVIELKADDCDPFSALRRVASGLDPLLLQRTVLQRHEQEMAV